MDIAKRVITLRTTLNLNQDEFGSKIGVTKYSVSSYENGKRKLTDRNINDICREFNVNEDWLRYGINEMFSPNGDEEIEALGRKYNLDSQSKAFIKEFSKLNELEKKVIFDVFMRIARTIDTNSK
jgi:transcriptional regulator with XRE-family HTH domain